MNSFLTITAHKKIAASYINLLVFFSIFCSVISFTYILTFTYLSPCSITILLVTFSFPKEISIILFDRVVITQINFKVDDKCYIYRKNCSFTLVIFYIIVILVLTTVLQFFFTISKQFSLLMNLFTH